MTSVKHTDGPWEVKETFLQDYQIWSVGGECIAIDVISKENTQLIAAAPDLFLLCKESLHGLNHVLEAINKDQMPHDGDDFHDLIGNLKRLISKVESKL